MSGKDSSDKEGNVWAQLARYLSLGFLLPVATVVGYAIGYALDQYFATHFLRTVCLALGAIGGFAELIRSVNRESGSK